MAKGQWNFPQSLKQLSGWSIIHIEGSKVLFPQKCCILSLEIDFILASHADPDEISPSCGISLSGLSMFVKEPVLGFLMEQNGNIFWVC